MPFSLFGWRSKGGEERRAELAQQQRVGWRTAWPAIEQAAQRVSEQTEETGRFLDLFGGRRDRPSEQREIAEGFAPRGLEAQSYAFRGIRPEEEGARRAAEFGRAVRPEDRPDLERIARGSAERGMSPEQFASAVGRYVPQTGADSDEWRLRLEGIRPRPLNPPESFGPSTFDLLGTLSRPLEEPIERLRPVTEPVGRFLGRGIGTGLGASTPIGMGPAPAPISPEQGEAVGEQVAPYVLDPLNLVPGIGFTKLPRGAAAARNAGKATAALRTAREVAQGAPLEQVAGRETITMLPSERAAQDLLLPSERARRTTGATAEALPVEAPSRMGAAAEVPVTRPTEGVAAPRLGAEAAVAPEARVSAEAAPPSPALEVDGVRVDDTEMLGVGAAQAARAPTMRDVEAVPARLTLQGRRAIAESKLQRLSEVGERSRTYDEVRQANGDRYQKTLLDPIFNFVRRAKGQDTKLIQDVRNELIMRDTYVRQEGGVLTARGGAWLGRNVDVLGINLEKGTMTKVRVRPGVKIPKAVAQTPKDIARHPDDYIFTPEQQAAWDEIQTVFQRNLLNEQRHGLDVTPIEGYYWPEAVLKAPSKSDVRLYRPTSQQNMSVSPWFTKSRTGIDPRSGKAAGIVYANDFSAMFLRLEGSAEAVANRSAIDSIKAMGYKPSEKLAASLSDELKDAQQAYQKAKPLFQSSDLADRRVYEAARDRLTAAKAAVRHEAHLLNERSPKLFGRVVPRDVAEEFSRYISKEDPSTIDEMFRVQRSIMVNGDYGSPMLQNYALFWNNPKAWLKSTAMGAAAIRRAPFEYLAQNSDEVERAIRTGFISPPSELMLSEGGRLSQRIGSLPPFKQAQRMFEWDIFVGQLERAKAHMLVIKDDKVLREIADVTRKQAGILFEPGITAAKASRMTKAWFAPQYLAALNAIFLDPLLKTGAARREAIKSMGMMLGGAASATIGFNYMLNGKLPNMDEPGEPGFWGIHMPDGTYIYPFGPLQPTIRALSETGINRDPKALARFFESKAAIPARWMIAAGEAMGLPLESIRGPAFGQPEKKLSIDEMVEKFKGGDIIGGIQQAGEQGLLPVPIGAAQTTKALQRNAPFGALESGGIRTTLPPTERSQAFQLRQELQAMPAYEGLEPDDQNKVEEFLSGLDDRRAQWRRDNPTREQESRADSIARLAPRELDDPTLVRWARVLASDTLRERNASRERDRFLLDNFELFDEQYPDLLPPRIRELYERRGSRR